MKPLVSIIITCYNIDKYLSYSIESVLNQTYTNIECIVVDDGSTDNTKEIVSKYIKKDERIRYFYKENGGAASARNLGISLSNGDWLHTLDGDDWIDPKKTEKQIEIVQKYNELSKYSLIYSDYGIAYQNDNGKIVKIEEKIIGELSQDEILKKIINRKFGLKEPTPITMNSMLLTRSIVEKYNYNESMESIEDLEFYYKFLQEEVQCIYVPIISMYYRQHEYGVSKNNKKSLKGYISFIESISKIKKSDLCNYPNLFTLMKNSIIYKDDDSWNRIMQIILDVKIPIFSHLNGRKIDIRKLILPLIKMNLLKVYLRLILISQRYIKRINFWN